MYEEVTYPPPGVAPRRAFAVEKNARPGANANDATVKRAAEIARFPPFPLYLLFPVYLAELYT